MVSFKTSSQTELNLDWAKFDQYLYLINLARKNIELIFKTQEIS
jgi:hypothetical protein